jgi:cytochrome c
MLELKMFKSIVIAAAMTVAMSATASYKNIGTETSKAELVDWDISVFFDGENLPEGSGNLEEGEEIYNARCAMCHGDFGEGANKYPVLLGAEVEDMATMAQEGENNVTSRGINNFWGHAPTLFDTIRRAMPYFAPQSLTADQTYSVTGYVLVLSEIIADDIEVIDADLLKSVKMPGRDYYVTDNRPDTYNERCMENCQGEIKKVYNIMDSAEE